MVVHSKLRSWLTILGIVIGVAAVIAIGSLGSGLQSNINQQLSSLGGDLLTITAGHSRGGNIFTMRGPGREGGGFDASSTQSADAPALTRTDVQALRGMPDIMTIDTQIRGSVKVTYQDKTGTISLTGVDQRFWSQITTETLLEGRMLGPADQNVVVIGSRLASSYFTHPVGINQMITIGNSAFRVVGILDDQSTSIYMPLQMAYQVIDDKTNGVYDTIIVRIRDQDLLDETIAKIDNKMMLARHVTDKTKDFTITSRAQAQETRAATMQTMNMFLMAIAAVSLIVGSVGIANTMFTSVMEKTKEIGIMKAIGARNKDIMLIFLLNAGLIGLVGGLLGIFFGTILSGMLPALMGNVGFFRSG
ncbi:ABC transporter permease, partial [Candidatus Woesearchaeota archaeon CG_4_10_14_0_2_um_filter_57_5]